MVDFWRIQPSELRGPRSMAAPVSAPPAVKYRHPVSGETWDGQGSQPQWLKEALLREGYTVQELRTAAPAQAAQGDSNAGNAGQTVSRTA
jgi:DNA-binding protein H-NS